MTDNEVIKDLERISLYSGFSDNVINTLLDALDLIKQQREKIDELKHEREVLIEDIHYSANKVNEQLEEIEKLERTILYLEGVCESIPDKVRTEAYKEFAERLKEGAQMADCFDSYNMVVGTHFINNLLKEMIDE